MLYRPFGATGLSVSEVGFGAWGIGGTAYGPVDRSQALRALAAAEHLGCNFVDTAMVYGDSELVLGEFLKGRRSRWIVATKYSGQPPNMIATLDHQLHRLGVDAVDYYQLHWTPHTDGADHYEQLDALKRAGKARFVGVSLYAPHDIDFVLDATRMDGIQVPFSLLDPHPFLARLDRLRGSRLGVIVRSSLKEGFLVGKFSPQEKFIDERDQRHTWSRRKIRRLVRQVDAFRYLERPAGSMARAAAAYPLTFPEVSTVILGTKTAAQAEQNFGNFPGARLDEAALERIARTQDELDLLGRRTIKGLLKRILKRE